MQGNHVMVSRRTAVRRLLAAVALPCALLLGGPALAGDGDAPAGDGDAPAESLLPADAPSPESPEFLRYVMNRVDDLYRGRSSHGVMEMKVKTQHWSRTMVLESWSLGTEYSLVRILIPMKEKGTATLKAGDDLYTYLNKTRRTIKISGAMMGASWMGSHFTNDDLVKDSRYSDDFDVALTGRGDAEGAATYEFTLTPKPDAAVVWGKVTVTIRQADLLPVSQVFYDEDGAAVRKLEFKEYKTVSGRTMPTVMKMTPLDQSGEYTQVAWKKMAFDVALEPSFFTLQRLKSI
ncbi:MAG: outer membrane lipoprotein-sorting protein [Myxococcales bacterium]|nr:outer membrane lipoprotein-sorting protein [Myxococcales bacterium]MCB9753168.1 outer membrane lipoprotein-sorting protein [Myxococcales bacterium]